MSISRLDVTLRDANIPIDGVSLLSAGPPVEVRIDFKDEATAQERAAAQSIVAGFDWSAGAETIFQSSREPLLKDLLDQAAAGVTAIDNYLATADTATQAQVRAEVKSIDQRQRKIILALARLVRLVRG